MLVDTSVLARTLQPHHEMGLLARDAIDKFRLQNRLLYLVPHLGFSISAPASELMRLKNMFVLLPDTPAIYSVWENLVIQYQVSGKLAHDARLVAAMKVHGLTSILTFDRTGFSRYAGIEVVHPADAGV